MMIYRILFLAMAISACSSSPIIPESSDIDVGRELPMGDCEEVGLLRGTTMTTMGTKQDALDDLKKTAANKGANYIKIAQFSETGTSVTGVAYICK